MQLRTQPNKPSDDAKLSEPTVATKKYLACFSKVFQTTTLPKFSLYQDSIDEYTIIFNKLSSQREMIWKGEHVC
jgi:hypothetical protein